MQCVQNSVLQHWYCYVLEWSFLRFDMQAGGSAGENNQQALQQPVASDAPLPAESPALKEEEVNADNGGTEFDAEAADSQTPVGAQG